MANTKNCIERAAQHMANEAFFDAVHARLNDGGVWAGDHATMFKHGALWYATLPNYSYMKMITSSAWMKKVVLMADASGTMSDRQLFNAVISAPAIPVPEEPTVFPCPNCEFCKAPKTWDTTRYIKARDTFMNKDACEACFVKSDNGYEAGYFE